jgi:hypothetical protein
VRPPPSKRKNTTVVLLDDNGPRRSARAMVLMTHGYDVHCAATMVEAQSLCAEVRPALVLIGTGQGRHTRGWLQQFAIHPPQRVGFLLNEGQYLCAVSFNGKTIRGREGPDDMITRVAKLLAVPDSTDGSRIATAAATAR